MNNGMIEFDDKYVSISTNKDQIQIKVRDNDNILSYIYLGTNDATMLFQYRNDIIDNPNCIFCNDSNTIMLYIYDKENLKSLVSWCRVFTNYTLMNIGNME